MNWAALLKLLSDFAADAPDLLKAVGVVEAVFADLAAGKPITITPAEMALVNKLIADVHQLEADLKAAGF